MYEMIDREGEPTPELKFESIFVRNSGSFYTRNGETGIRTLTGKNIEVCLFLYYIDLLFMLVESPAHLQ